MLGFVKASRQAKDLLAKSDEEWTRIRPLMQIDDDAVFKNTVKQDDKTELLIFVTPKIVKDTLTVR